MTTRSPWPGVQLDLGAPAERTQQEPAPGPERDGGDHRVAVGAAVAVAVPGHGVAAVPVEVDPDPVEVHPVPPGQGAGQRAQRRRHVVGGHLGRPPGGQPRLEDRPVVHPHRPLPEPPALQELGEQLVGPAQPPRGRVDPGAVVQADPPEPVERRVGLGASAVEQRPLKGDHPTTVRRRYDSPAALSR